MTGLESFEHRAELNLANTREMVIKPTTALAVVRLLEANAVLVDAWFFDEAGRADAVTAVNDAYQDVCSAMTNEEFMRGNYRVDFEGRGTDVVPHGMTAEEVANRG